MSSATILRKESLYGNGGTLEAFEETEFNEKGRVVTKREWEIQSGTPEFIKSEEKYLYYYNNGAGIWERFATKKYYRSEETYWQYNSSTGKYDSYTSVDVLSIQYEYTFNENNMIDKVKVYDVELHEVTDVLTYVYSYQDGKLDRVSVQDALGNEVEWYKYYYEDKMCVRRMGKFREWCFR